MEQVMRSSFEGNFVRNLLGPMWSFGTGGGITSSFREMAFSIASTILILNLANTLKLLPHNLLFFLQSWLRREINIKIPENNQDFFPGNVPYFNEGNKDFSPVSNIFSAAEMYISSIALASDSNSSFTDLLRAKIDHRSRNVILTIDNSQVITDTFCSKDHKPVVVKWRLHREQTHEGKSPQGGNSHERYFIVTFNGRKVGFEAIKEYLKHVIATSDKIASKNRQLKLYTNKRSNGGGGPGYKSHGMWNMVMFNHPASFDTFAMDPTRKKKIMEDLDTFSKCREYYAKIGKAWKRGYLLYGPPGTGKSTMIACIANYLKYDIYDLELTAVKDNTQLRQLMVNLPSKAIIVIEDIDCSLDLSGARKPVTREERQEEMMMTNMVDTKDSNVTLSGLLNCIDGLWSTSGGERLIVFTTNHIGKLDPALIRKGRMDVQIELSYCKFKAFKELAKNYLEIDEHPLYARVEELLEVVDITPADVAEQLLPKNLLAENRAEECLEELIMKMEKLLAGKEG